MNRVSALALTRRQLLATSTLVLLLGRSQLAGAATILAVRLWPAKDYTRLTIESDVPLQATQRMLTHPHRLVVDIQGITLNPQLRELVGNVRPDDPYISQVRIGQNTQEVVRLVLDLKQPVAPQVFNLPPVAAYRNRLVLDLYPTQAIDPLEELVAAYANERAPAQASKQEIADSIDELLAQLQGEPTAGSAALGGPALSTTAPYGKKPADDPFEALIAQHSAATKPQTKAPVAQAPSTRPAPSKPLQDFAKGATTQPALAPITSKPAKTPTLRPGAAGLPAQRLIIVALDPGHGGEDPGAIGPAGTQEKDVVLAIAHKLAARINATQIGGNPLRAFLTRDADFFVPLRTRVLKAQQVRADLFISIHADAFTTPQARGASVFALSQRGASSAAANWLANKENKADAVGGVNIRSADPLVERTFADMSVTVQIRDSLKLGNNVLRYLGHFARLHKPRVEQASFAVLKAPDIPSVLVETAFISNPEEEQRLRDEAYQHQLADALMQGIVRYFAQNPPLARSRAV